MSSRHQTVGQAWGMCSDSRFCDLKDADLGCMNQYNLMQIKMTNLPNAGNQIRSYSIPGTIALENTRVIQNALTSFASQ